MTLALQDAWSTTFGCRLLNAPLNRHPRWAPSRVNPSGCSPGALRMRRTLGEPTVGNLTGKHQISANIGACAQVHLPVPHRLFTLGHLLIALH